MSSSSILARMESKRARSMSNTESAIRVSYKGTISVQLYKKKKKTVSVGGDRDRDRRAMKLKGREGGRVFSYHYP